METEDALGFGLLSFCAAAADAAETMMAVDAAADSAATAVSGLSYFCAAAAVSAAPAMDAAVDAADLFAANSRRMHGEQLLLRSS